MKNRYEKRHENRYGNGYGFLPKDFTAENVQIFYDKLTSSGMTVPVLELDRRQGSSSAWGTCAAHHLMGGE